MRLLDTRTAGFVWVDEPRHVSYAILSHLWTHDSDARPEQTYTDIATIQRRHRHERWPFIALSKSLNQTRHSANKDSIPSQVSDKIRRCCAIAREHGYERVWIDSCCIDKGSSSELSEAVNSMYQWYHHARVCYAFLADVEDGDDPRAAQSQFRQSRWFRRGWTLQELIAPRVLVFLSKGWRVLGTKAMLARVIEEVTGIDGAILTHEASLDTISIAKRMSWAAGRKTTREEDEAYSLMGILNVHMPTIYGEGRFAFIRLQEEVLKQTSDQTLFAWGPTLRDNAEFEDEQLACADSGSFWEQSEEAVWESPYIRNLFALSPCDFSSSGRVVCLTRDEFQEKLQLTCPLPDYTLTGHGIRTTVPLLTARSSHSEEAVHLAILACQDGAGRLLALILRNQEHTHSEYFVGAFLCPAMTITDDHRIDAGEGRSFLLGELYYRTTHLSSRFIATHRESIRLQEVYIPHRPSRARTQAFQGYRDVFLALARCDGSFKVQLADWCKSILDKDGYAVSPIIPITDLEAMDPRNRGFIISKGSHAFKIELDTCGCEKRMRDRWLRVVVSAHLADQHDSVSSEMPQRTFIPGHARDHPDHVYSWTFAAGIFSRKLHVPCSDGLKLTIQLTLSLADAGTATDLRRTYSLGVELVEPQHCGPKRHTPPDHRVRDDWAPPVAVVTHKAESSTRANEHGYCYA